MSNSDNPRKVTADDLYIAVVERIKQSDDRFKTTPRNLVREVCKSNYGVDFDSTGINDFDMFDLIHDKAKENGYTIRAVPVKEEKWGLPYNFEYFFYPYRKR